MSLTSRRRRSTNSRKIARKSNPALWESIKRKWICSNKGGKSGKNSARKMQLAVQEYKRRGGKYIGPKSRSNSMRKWTKEDWGYITPRSKKGRYLPKKVRQHLTSKEKRTENRLKGSKKGKWISYSSSVRKKVRKYISK